MTILFSHHLCHLQTRPTFRTGNFIHWYIWYNQRIENNSGDSRLRSSKLIFIIIRPAKLYPWSTTVIHLTVSYYFLYAHTYTLRTTVFGFGLVVTRSYGPKTGSSDDLAACMFTFLTLAGLLHFSRTVSHMSLLLFISSIINFWGFCSHYVTIIKKKGTTESLKST